MRNENKENNRLSRLKKSRVYQRCRRYRWWAAVLVLCLVAQSGIFPAGIFSYGANPDPFPYFTGVRVTDTKDKDLADYTEAIDPEQQIRIHYDYDFISASESDIVNKPYTFTLPKQVTQYQDLEYMGKLYGSGGGIGTIVKIADVHFAGSTGTITFTSDGFEHFNAGTFWFSASLDAGELGEGGGQPIRFPLEGHIGGGITIDLDIEPIPLKPEVTIDKGAGTPNMAAGTIHWTAKAVFTGTLSEKPAAMTFANVKLSDTLPEGLSYREGSLTLSRKEGSSVQSLADPADYTLETTGNQVIVTVHGEVAAAVDAEVSYVLEYDTSFEPLNLKNGDTEYKNSIKTEYDYYQSTQDKNEGRLTAGMPKNSAAAAVVNAEFISKDSSYIRNPGSGGKIDWTVVVNKSGMSVPDAVLTDTIPAGLTLDENTVKLDSALITTADPKLTIVKNPDQTTKLTYSFGAGTTISELHTLTYTTTIAEDWYEGNNQLQFTNIAGFKGTGLPEKIANKVQSVGQSLINACGSNSYDAEKKEITWQVNANENEVTMPAGTVISFTIPDHLAMIGNTDIKTKAGNLENTGDFDILVSGRTVTLTSRTAINGKVTVHFATEVDIDQYYTNHYKGSKNSPQHSYQLENLKIKLKNAAAAVTGKTCPVTFDSKMLTKSGKYDYQTKELTWILTLNENKLALNGASISDILPNELEYVEGSAKLGSTLLDVGQVAVNGQNVTFTLGSLTGKQTLTYKTRLKAEWIQQNKSLTVKNNAKLTATHTSAGDVSADAQDSVTVSSELVNKKGAKVSGKNQIQWTIYINKNLQEIEDPVLEDPLIDTLSYVSGSLKIYDATVDAADGSFTKGSEAALPKKKILYDQDKNKLTVDFGQAVTRAYIVEFKTDMVNLEAGNATFENSASFRGMGGIQNGSQNSSFEVACNVDAGGIADSYLGRIEMTKRSKDALRTPLAGAVFELRSADGTKVIASSEPTGQDGKTAVRNIRSGTYVLRESTPPIGYLAAADQTVTVTFGKGSQIHTLEVLDQKIKGNFELTKLQAGTAGTPNPVALKGAEISIYKNEGTGAVQLIGAYTTDDSGKISVSDLEYGTYYYIETKAPAGYLLDKTQYAFQISIDGYTVSKIMENTKQSSGGGSSSKPPIPQPDDPEAAVDPEEPFDPDKPLDEEASSGSLTELPQPIDREVVVVPIPGKEAAAAGKTVFKLENGEGTVSEQIVLDQDGKFYFPENLPAGRYRITNTQTGETVEFTIEEDQVPLAEMTFEEKAAVGSGAMMPKTGTLLGAPALYGLGALALLAGVLLRRRHRR